MEPVLKVELHAHSNLDPHDGIPHTTRELIDRAAQLGYHALSVTCHNHYFDPAQDMEYARERGIVLLSGVERTIRRAHLLLINFSDACQQVHSFDDAVTLKHAEPRGLVIAPHPLYPTPSAMGLGIMNRYRDLFDAVEVSSLYTRQVNFNARAVEWARANGKPLVGNSDVHTLAQLGTTYTLVDAAPDPDAICWAIKEGRIELHTQPLTTVLAARHFGAMLITGAVGLARRTYNRLV
jgi:predicted metal-dependent phosphoesterase TrpH